MPAVGGRRQGSTGGMGLTNAYVEINPILDLLEFGFG